jgi:hypothetical protein
MSCDIDHYAFAIMMVSLGAGMLAVAAALARSIWKSWP